MVPVLAIALSLLMIASAQAAVILSEIDYDQPGTDEMEWVELHNPDAVPMSLVNLELVMINSSTCTEYGNYDLDAITIPAGGYVVVGNYPCADPSVTFPPTNAIQNGAPDGVFIRNRDTLLIVDEVEYEAAGGSVCLNNPTSAADSGALDNYSIQYCTGQGWIEGIFSPCAENFECDPVSSKDSTWGTLKAQF
ncbi:MAG: lamin tail domain-containing protein [Actinomycetia bacterium]|nr:lamin tail domain-containing protein [Actinomycetes bacterium]